MNILAWTRFAAALEYYRNLKYEYREVPWLVDITSITATFAKPGYIYEVEVAEHSAGALVGSGEQGFIELLQRRELAPGRYMTITPCFRHEERYDELTREYFMKLELFDNTGNTGALAMPHEAARFMRRWHRDLRIVETEIGQDIVTRSGVELGSYGLRRLDGLGEFIYGTGLAEPRFTVSLEKGL